MQLVQVQLQEGQPLLPQVRKGCHIYLWIYGLLIVCWVFVTSPSTYFDDRLIYTEQAAPAAPSVPSRAARRNQLRVATWEGSLTPLVDSYTAGVQHENRLLAALNTIAFWSHLEDDVSFNFRILAHHGPCDSQPNTVFCDKRTPVIWVSRQRLGVFRLREKNMLLWRQKTSPVDLKVWRGYDPVGERHVATPFWSIKIGDAIFLGITWR